MCNLRARTYLKPWRQDLCITLELGPMYYLGAKTNVQLEHMSKVSWNLQSKYTTLDTRLLSVYFKSYLIEAKKILNSIYINTFWSSKIQYGRLFPFNNEFCSSRCSSEEKKKVWKQPFLLHLALYLIFESKSHLLSTRQVRIILLAK